MVGSITYTIERSWKDPKGKLHHIGKIRFSAAYVANGDSLSLGNMFRSIEHIDPTTLEDSGGYQIQVTDTSFATPKATNSILVELYYGDWNAIANGPLIEAANGDYSAVYARVHIVGLPA